VSVTSPSYQELGPCPCEHPRCVVIGTKLTRFGHLTSCGCSECMGRRNQRKGRKGQRQAHKVLGGEGFSAFHEESGRTYSVEVQVEVKKGRQVNPTLTKGLRSAWLSAALGQAERAIPVGVVAFPSCYVEPEGGGRWLIVDLR
jgi:hypothetical protein